ncbi:MAG: hypothetical protein WCT03_17440 [Candidatus Obscuribacterales bacterium]
MKRKIRRVTVFYWLISITVVSWCFAMLYIYSWRSSWAGKVVLDEVIRKEEREQRTKISILEEMGAPDNDITEARVNLAKMLLQLGEYNSARFTLDDAERRITDNKSPDEPQTVLLERIKLNKFAALICRDSGLYQFAQDRYDKIDKLMAAVKPDEQLQYQKLVLLNDQAILQYIWANASKKESDRKTHFAQAQMLFQKCIEQSDKHLAESEGSKYKRLVEISQANLSELKRDL